MTTDCILWQKCRNRKGYGQVRRNGKTYLAHRWAWEQVNGPIPDGLCVLHHCDNPPCVNQEHLFLGTATDNNADRDQKGRARGGRVMGDKNGSRLHPETRATGERNGSRTKPERLPRGEQHGCAKLTEAQVLMIRSDSRSLRLISADYGVSPTLISRIKSRQRWAHI